MLLPEAVTHGALIKTVLLIMQRAFRVPRSSSLLDETDCSRIEATHYLAKYDVSCVFQIFDKMQHVRLCMGDACRYGRRELMDALDIEEN